MEGEDKLPTPVSLMPLITNPVVDRDGRFTRRLPNLKSIDCDELDTLMDLNGCPSGLEELGCRDCKLINSLAPLAACTNLTKLDLYGTTVTNLKPLMGCVKLEWLDISDTPVSDLRPLSACINLKVFRLWDTPVSDLRPLSGLHQLRHLDLENTAVTDLSPLSSLSLLETLLCNITNISDLTPLSMCSELKALNIYDTEVKSLAPLLQCKRLKYFNHGKLKDQNADETRGYVRLLREQMPEMIVICSVASSLDIPDELHHRWSMY